MDKRTIFDFFIPCNYEDRARPIEEYDGEIDLMEHAAAQEDCRLAQTSFDKTIDGK